MELHRYTYIPCKNNVIKEQNRIKYQAQSDYFLKKDFPREYF